MKKFCVVEVNKDVAEKLKQVADEKMVSLNTLIVTLLQDLDGFDEAVRQHLTNPVYDPVRFYVRIPEEIWNKVKSMSKDYSFSLQRAIGIQLEKNFKQFLREVKHGEKSTT